MRPSSGGLLRRRRGPGSLARLAVEALWSQVQEPLGELAEREAQGGDALGFGWQEERVLVDRLGSSMPKRTLSSRLYDYLRTADARTPIGYP